MEKQVIAVDASCRGNPGPMEYRGVHLETGEVLFHKHFTEGTNNVGEFLAIVHAAAFLKKKNLDYTIYSDSNIAIKWVKHKRCGTTLAVNKNTREVISMVNRAVKWLNNNNFDSKVIKWDTKRNGEIPADFGRKNNFLRREPYDLCAKAAEA